MKFLSFFFYLFLSVAFSWAQNSTDKYQFTEIVKRDSINAGLLIKNAKSWLRNYKLENLDTLSLNKLSGSSSFYVYQKGFVSKQIHGRIYYNITIEIKDYKYRYTFTDFVFHYYKQDRNYKMVPTGKVKPLDDKEATGWQKTWTKHKDFTTKQIGDLINNLKTAMSNDPNAKPAQVVPKVNEEF